MEGPGEYLPDVTEGITRVEDLPKPRIVKRSRNYKRRPCPSCGRSAYRDRVVRVHPARSGRPEGRPPGGPGGHLLPAPLLPLRHLLQRRHGRPGPAQGPLHPPRGGHGRPAGGGGRLALSHGQLAPWRDHRVFVPFATIQNWVEAGGKKAEQHVATAVSGRGPGRLLRVHRRRRTV